MSPIGRLDYRCIRRRSAKVVLKLRRWKRQIVGMIGRETNEPPHFRVPDPGHCVLPLGTRHTKKHGHVIDGRNVDGSSAEEILNIPFIERQAKLTQGWWRWIDTDHLNASPDKRGRGGQGRVSGSSVEFNVDRPYIRCRRKAVDVLERGQRHAVALLFMFMETGPFAEIAAGNYLA